jgi:hypothetical protein
LKIVDKEVSVNMDVPARVVRSIYDFETRYGRQPAGIALGPNEYYAVMQFAIGRSMAEHASSGGWKLDKFYGFPVSVKATPGFDLLVPREMAPMLAIGEIVKGKQE